MKKYMEPEVEIVKLEAVDVICESVEYGKAYYADNGDDFIGWA